MACRLPGAKLPPPVMQVGALALRPGHLPDPLAGPLGRRATGPPTVGLVAMAAFRRVALWRILRCAESKHNAHCILGGHCPDPCLYKQEAPVSVSQGFLRRAFLHSSTMMDASEAQRAKCPFPQAIGLNPTTWQRLPNTRQQAITYSLGVLLIPREFVPQRSIFQRRTHHQEACRECCWDDRPYRAKGH